MAREFPEVAHNRTDMEKYRENYDRIFKKLCEGCKKAPQEIDVLCKECAEKEEKYVMNRKVVW